MHCHIEVLKTISPIKQCCIAWRRLLRVEYDEVLCSPDLSTPHILTQSFAQETGCLMSRLQKSHWIQYAYQIVPTLTFFIPLTPFLPFLSLPSLPPYFLIQSSFPSSSLLSPPSLPSPSLLHPFLLTFSLISPSSLTPSWTLLPLPSSLHLASWRWPKRQRGRKMPPKPGNLSTSCLTWYSTLNIWWCIARPAFPFWEDVFHWFSVV